MGSTAPHSKPQARPLPSLDAGGALSPEIIDQAKKELARRGAIHVVNTGLRDARQMSALLEWFGFGEKDQYREGGRTSEDWQKKWAAPGLRRMDYYPPQFHLVANTEVQYRHDFPARILLFCAKPSDTGGREFMHDAAEVLRVLEKSPGGRPLVEKILLHGLMIETGFLDRNHPLKAQNFHMSWQERFKTDDPEEALAAARARSDEYHDCWWKDGHGVLMTRITLPGFMNDKRGEACLRFPRIAMNGPAPENGYRRFPLGNGEELSAAEIALLKSAYHATEQEVAWQAGDIVLFDNIRFGHSREPYTGERELLVGMAGLERI